MTSYLPAIRNLGSVAQNLELAKSTIGSGEGTGETYLKVDDRTGAMSFGKDRTPLPSGHKFVLGVHAFMHGYIDSQGGKVVERHVVPMALQPDRPKPKGGSSTKDKNGSVRTLGPGEYGTFEGGGPKDVTEIHLNSIDEPGFNLVFTAWGVSSSNRIRQLLGETVQQIKTPDGQAGFVNPVIEVKTSHYTSKATEQPREVHHFDYDIVDWLHGDGTHFLSAHGGALEDLSNLPPRDIFADRHELGDVQGDPPPWEDEDDEMTEDEAELLDPNYHSTSGMPKPARTS